MKKLFLILALCTVFAITACGSSKKTNDDTDSGEAQNDEDVADTEQDGDIEPSDDGDSQPVDTDTTPEQPDDVDSTDDSDTTPEQPDDADSTPGPLPECSSESGTPCVDSSFHDLIWSSKSEKAMSQKDAADYCEKLNEDGYSDWLLPNLGIVFSLLQNCGNLYSDEGCEGSPDVQYSKLGDTESLWTSTAEEGYVTSVSFSNADPGPKLEENSDELSYFVRCVRKEVLSRTADCETPENANHNTVSSITQKWDWDATDWLPSTKSVFSNEASTKECRYTCKEGLISAGGKCREKVTASSLPECTPGNGTPCLDPATNLVWSSPKYREEGTNLIDSVDLNSAVEYCETLDAGGFTDWSIPSVDEFRTIILNCPATETGGECNATGICRDTDSFQCKNDACQGCEFNADGLNSKPGVAGRFWSSSVAYRKFGRNAFWIVDLFSGRIESFGDGSVLDVICVR